MRGDDGDDRLADVAHLADRERVVLDVPARRRRDLEERVGELRDLVAGQRAVDAVERRRLRDVDRARCARARTASGRSGRSAMPCALTSSTKTPSPWTSRLSSLRGTSDADEAGLVSRLLDDDRRLRRDGRLAHGGTSAAASRP